MRRGRGPLPRGVAYWLQVGVGLVLAAVEALRGAGGLTVVGAFVVGRIIGGAAVNFIDWG